MINIIDIPSVGFIREKLALKIIPVCRSTWWGGIKTGKYPKPYKLGPHSTAWCAQEMLALVERIKADRK